MLVRDLRGGEGDCELFDVGQAPRVHPAKLPCQSFVAQFAAIF